MKKAKNFSEPISDGYQIYLSRLEVAGIQYGKSKLHFSKTGNKNCHMKETLAPRSTVR